MADIILNEGKQREAIVFNKIHLERFILQQPLDGSAKKRVSMTLFLFGTDSEGKVVYDYTSRKDLIINDFDGYAIKLHVNNHNCSEQQAFVEYMNKIAEANMSDTGILDSMAMFIKGIGQIYEFEEGKSSNLGL